MLSRRDLVAHLFKSHPGVWLDGREFAKPGGVYAWRTRIAECRTVLGMTIKNRRRKVGRATVSEYRYTPPSELPAESTADLNRFELR